MTRVLPEVTVYAGPMGAGKTTRLYGKMGELTHLGIPYEAYRPGVDVRDVLIAPRGYVVGANAALTPNCSTVETLADIPIEELVQRGIKTLFLEEWFMFGFDQQRRPISGLYRHIMGRWALAGIERVYAAGLDQAASGNQFGLVLDARRYGAKSSCVRPGANIPSMVNAIPNAGVSPATVKSMMSVTTGPLIWRPYLTCCPKGCVRMIAIVPSVHNTCSCPQNRPSPLTPCKPDRLPDRHYRRGPHGDSRFSFASECNTVAIRCCISPLMPFRAGQTA